MKALVTGGCGFIGSHLVDKLIDLGATIWVFDKKEISLEKNKGIECHWQGDVVNYEGVKWLMDIFRPDYIFHLAAIPAVKISISNPLATMRVNVLGALNVLEAARLHKVKRVILISSAAVYGARSQNPTEKLSEDRDLRILNPYALSKKWLEEAGKLWASKEIWDGVETVSLRYFNVYGPRQRRDAAYATCIERFLYQWRNGEAFTIVPDGKQRRDFIHVYDVVDAAIRAAFSKKITAGEVINIGSGKNYSILEIADIIGNKDYPRVFIEPRPGEARYVLADISKVRELLDWEPRIFFEWGINQLKEEISKN